MSNDNKKPDNTRESSGDTDWYSQTKRPANIPSSEPPLTPIPRLIKKGYELVFPSKKGELIVMKKATVPPEDPVEAYKRSMQWKWWLIGIMASFIGVGFYASQHLSTYETKRETQINRANHAKIHSKIDERFEIIQKRIDNIRLEQVRQSEQSKLINTRLELLLEVQSSKREAISERDRRLNDVEAERLRREIVIQQERLKRLERDPRVQKAMSDDPLESLDL